MTIPDSSKRNPLLISCQLFGLALLCLSIFLMIYKHISFVTLLPVWIFGLFLSTMAPAAFQAYKSKR